MRIFRLGRFAPRAGAAPTKQGARDDARRRPGSTGNGDIRSCIYRLGSIAVGEDFAPAQRRPLRYRPNPSARQETRRDRATRTSSATTLPSRSTRSADAAHTAVFRTAVEVAKGADQRITLAGTGRAIARDRGDRRRW